MNMQSDSDAYLSMNRILDRVPQAVTVQDTQGNVVYANRAAARLVGVKSPQNLVAGQAVGLMTGFELYNEAGKLMKLSDLPGRKALKTATEQTQLIHFKVKATGKEYWSLVKADPIIDRGKVQGVVNTFYDLTPLKKVEHEFELLAEVSNAMASSLNYDARLNKLARLLVPRVADWCVIDVVDNEGNISIAAAEHRSAEKEVLARKLHRGLFHTLKKSAVWKAISSGKPSVYNATNLNSQLFGKPENKAGFQEIIDTLNFQSMVIMPLIAREKTLGAITFVMAESGRELTKESLPFLKRLTNKVALMADNARLYTIMRREIEKQRLIQNELIEREKTLNFALEAGQMMTWEWDSLVGNFTWSNHIKTHAHHGKTFYRGSLEEFLALVDEPSASTLLRDLKNSLSNGSNIVNEIKVTFPSHETRWLFIKGQAIPDKRGLMTKMAGIGIDITERKLDEEEIRDNETKFKTIFGMTLDSIIITDEKLRILDVNSAATELLGSKKKDLLKKKLPQILLAHNPDPAALDFTPKTTELEITTPEGKRRTVAYNTFTHFLPGQMLFMIRDITEQKLENKRRDHFLGIASHELKSPLASIKAILHIVKKKFPEQVTDGVAEYLEKIDTKVDILTLLINDLLDVTRIRQGKLEFKYQMFDLNELIREVVEETHLTSKHQRIKVADVSLPNIVADRNRIAQVLRNLLRNALKYSPELSPVLLKTSTKKKILEIQVIDQGPGIAVKERTRIFDLYYRSEAKKQTAQGLGVGLFITAQIIKQHGGKIWVESGKQGGSIFCVNLPLQPRLTYTTRTLFKTTATN